MKLRIAWPIVLVAALAVVGIVLIPRSSAERAPSLVGTDMHGLRAPNFTLRDQFGQSVSLSHLRGRTVILTFLESHCTGLCPVVGEAIHRVLVGLGPERRRVAVLAISTAPEDDSVSAIRKFSNQLGMWDSWHYLREGRDAMTPVWHDYYIYAPPRGSSESANQGHTSATYLIDSRGRERILLGGGIDTETLNRDVRILANLPVGALRSAIPAPEVGHIAPNFTLPALQGRPITLSDLRGKVVLLNFWATWCGPCRSEMPELAGWRRLSGSSGFVILGVDQLEGAGTVRAFVHRLHIPYPIALDENGQAAALYDVIGTPTSILIDRSGYVGSVNPGILSKAFYASHIASLLRSST